MPLKKSILYPKYFFTGHFGVVYKAFYTNDNQQTKVAIKTLKGNYIIIGANRNVIILCT